MEELERLRGEVDRLLKERSAVSHLSREMNQADSVSELLQATMAHSLQLFSADAGLIYLLPMEGAATGTIESSGISSTASANVERLLSWWLSRAGRNPSPTAIITGPELPDDASLLCGDEPASSLLLASISAADRLIGVIGFQRTVAAHGCYGVAEAELLESVAGQIDTTYDRLRLRACDTSAFQDISRLGIHSADLLRTARELAVQEERSRIAREIHDGVSQNLALLILKMEIISRLTDTDPQRVKAELTKAQSIIEATVNELRRSIYTLRSDGSPR